MGFVLEFGLHKRLDDLMLSSWTEGYASDRAMQKKEELIEDLENWFETTQWKSPEVTDTQLLRLVRFMLGKRLSFQTVEEILEFMEEEW